MASTPSNTRSGISKTPSRTPNQPSARRLLHTPLNHTGPRDLLNSVRHTPAHRRPNNAPTPHAKAARRALHDRRTAIFTPGKNRRKSMLNQRDSPMGILRNLSRALAPTSKAISSSSSSASTSSPHQPNIRPQSSLRKAKGRFEDDDDDDELPIDRPRLSLPIDQDDDDDEEELRPPRLSEVVGEENYTMQSIELPRRQDMSRLSRGSFGSARVSDYFNPEEETRNLGRESDFFSGFLEDFQARRPDDVEYERIDDDQTQRMEPMGRESDFNLDMPAGLDDQTEFFLDDAPADIDMGGETLPIVEQSIVEATAHNLMKPLKPMNAMEPIETTETIKPFVPTETVDPMEGMDAMDDDFSDREPIEDIPEDMPENMPDQDSIAHISDREPMESIHDDPVKEQDTPIDEAISDRGEISENEEVEANDVEVTTTEARHAHQSHKPIHKIKRTPESRNALKSLKNQKRISRHGTEYPALPPAFVKRVAQTALQSSGLSNSRISPDTLAALTQASEWFFEQLADDLGAYAEHAKRKTIEESDVVTLMRRQRQIKSSSTMFSLAHKHLPRELLQELRMPPPQPVKQSRRKKRQDDEEPNEES